MMVSRKSRADVGLDDVDHRRLRTNRYADNCHKWTKVFVIRNLKYSNKVAELRATSFSHACTLIGWRQRQVELISEVGIQDHT